MFHRSRFFHGRTIPGTEVKDVTWQRPDGTEMAEADWTDGGAKCLRLVLSGEAGQFHLTATGEPEPDDDFLVIMNASMETITHVAPKVPSGGVWETLIDTGTVVSLKDAPPTQREPLKAGQRFDVEPNTLVLMIRRRAPLATNPAIV